MTVAKKSIKPETELRKIKTAIKTYCKACSGDSESERDKCNFKKCPLWEYRK